MSRFFFAGPCCLGGGAPFCPCHMPPCRGPFTREAWRSPSRHHLLASLPSGGRSSPPPLTAPSSPSSGGSPVGGLLGGHNEQKMQSCILGLGVKIKSSMPFLMCFFLRPGCLPSTQGGYPPDHRKSGRLKAIAKIFSTPRSGCRPPRMHQAML